MQQSNHLDQQAVSITQTDQQSRVAQHQSHINSNSSYNASFPHQMVSYPLSVPSSPQVFPPHPKITDHPEVQALLQTKQEAITNFFLSQKLHEQALEKIKKKFH